MNDHSPTPQAEVVARLREALEAGPTTGVWMRNARLNGPFWHISSDHTIGGEPCKSGLQAVASVHGESKRGAKAYAAMFEANADWIAAASPSAILALLNALDSATAREAELSAAMEDAGRYRALRMMDWFSGPLCVVRNPKRFFSQPLALGTDCPSRDRLDAAIDAAIAASPSSTKEQP